MIEELIERLKDLNNYVLLDSEHKTIDEAIFYLKHYAEIRKVVDEWNRDYHDIIPATGYFKKILDTFKE